MVVNSLTPNILKFIININAEIWMTDSKTKYFIDVFLEKSITNPYRYLADTVVFYFDGGQYFFNRELRGPWSAEGSLLINC